MTAIAGALALLVLAGALAALARPGSRVAARLNFAAVALAAIACGAPAVGVLVSGEPRSLVLPWSVPGGALALGLDPLSAFFLLPVAALSAITACYGVEYLATVPRPARVAWPAFDALIAGIPPAVGPCLAGLGLAGAWLGISLALQQRDLERALAYSSIENLGWIAIGLGLAAWGSQRGNAALALFGMMGALLHIWKSLLWTSLRARGLP